MSVSASNSVPREPERLWGRVPGLPAWTVSLLVHALLLVVLAILLRAGPSRGLTSERTAEVGIALKYQEGPREYFVSETTGDTSEAAAGQANEATSALAEAMSDHPPVDPSDALPSALPVIGASAEQEGGVPRAGGSTSDRGFGHQVGGGGSASLFGISAQGNKFVYVFDRSGSMGGVGRSALDLAKRELLTSIASLERTQQFEIIFYNHEPAIFNPSGRPGRIPFADEQSKRRATGFVASITADGGTDHLAALRLALGLRPDVVFFLTDADEPQLSQPQLDRVHAWAGGAVIHTIEFGLGPESGRDNFIKKLARQNRGQYVYIDITRATGAGR